MTLVSWALAHFVSVSGLRLHTRRLQAPLMHSSVTHLHNAVIELNVQLVLQSSQKVTSVKHPFLIFAIFIHFISLAGDNAPLHQIIK